MRNLIILIVSVLAILVSCGKDDNNLPTDDNPNDTSKTDTNKTDTSTNNTTIKGTVITYAGSTKGLEDGSNLDAKFQFPYGLYSNDKYLFVTHAGNFDVIKKTTPFVIRKVDLTSENVSTLITIGDKLYDNANEDKAKASSMVIIGDTIYMALAHRFYAINTEDGVHRSTALSSTTDSYGKLFIHENRVYAVHKDKSVFEINLGTGNKNLAYTIAESAISPSHTIQDVTKIGSKLYLSTHSQEYELWELNITDQSVTKIAQQTEAGVYGYGFDKITNDGEHIYYSSTGRNGATYVLGKILVADKQNVLYAKKNKGYNDGTLEEAEFDSPTDGTYSNGSLYIIEAGNLKIRKISFE
ncbi:MAG: hypothetical protein KDC92_05830 [Bacteroidetes bacterium]|nr:hypothetical protein [Bacteroidota bacterium]